MKTLLSSCIRITTFLCLFLAGGYTLASPATWTFSPSKVGRALHEGGWTIEYSLGNIHVSPEFSFPLQLIYRNNRTQAGIFGSQWWCPQLESSVLPRGRGILVWTMPSGGMVGFKVDPKRASDYQSFDGNWRARISGIRINIFNAEGWQYAYSRGRLDAVTSPTGRVLELIWSGERFQGMQLRDVASGTRLPLMRAAYGDNRMLAVLEINGQKHGFTYTKDGSEQRLIGWVPPVGRPVSFAYDPKIKVLVRTVLGDGKDRADIAEFKTKFVQPFEGDKPKKEPNAKSNPANWWLVSDPQFDYAYAHKGKNGDQWLSDQITITGRTGMKQKVDFAANRGILTAKPETGPERKTYYYRAPGQRYDGKLRRIEEGGKLLVEYRYDRRTGLMTEMHDATGIITFFDYNPGFRPTQRELWEPKPIRVRRGTRKVSETLGEYAYDGNGRLIQSKSITGNITRYNYSSRGELASVTDSEGGTMSFVYDQLGRYISVTRNDLTERMEYDTQGRIKAQIAADGTRTEFVFGKTGQIEAVKQNGETAIEYLRNELGQVIGEKDSLARIRKIERDLRGNLMAEHAPNGSVTRYEYDEFNRRVAQTDGNGNKITFDYDPMGRLVKQTNPLGGTLTWNYDDKGRITERTNGEQIIRHTYDKEGRLTVLDYGNNQKIVYTHDKEGRVLSATTPNASFEYSYDKLGRVVGMIAKQDNDEHLIRYTHNARGQRTSLFLGKLIPAVPSMGGRAGKVARYEMIQQTHYTYDTAGRLAQIITNGRPAVSYRYDSVGRVIQKLYGGDKPENASMVANIGYDNRSRLTHIEFSGTNLTPALQLTYEWDSASQLARRTWKGQTQRYEYDPGGQLLKVLDDQTNEVLESYRYDHAGNMLEKVVDGRRTAMVYNAANQLTKKYDLPSTMNDREDANTNAAKELEKLAQKVTSYSYDKAGRMLGTEGGYSNTYGWLDKVTELTQPGGSNVAFTYWPDGQLAVKKATGAQATSMDADSFLWDGLALLKRNDTIYIIEPHPNGGIPVASHPAGRPDAITWHLNDLLGTTLATVEKGVPRFAQLTAFGQPLKLASNIEPPTSALQDVPGIPSIPAADSIQTTTLNP